MAPTAGTRLRFKKTAAKGQVKHQKKVPSLKNRIRALERFLKRGGNLDDKTRAAKTRELEQLQQERNEKERLEEEKKNAEKYKKPRFFERVKLMRKLKKAEALLESAADGSKEKRAFQKEYDQLRHDLTYLYYYPKAEQYLSLFPAKPHSDENLKRQEKLRKEAIARFEEEQPLDAFHQFCYADGNAAPAAANTASILQVKKPTKEEEKKKQKKKNKKDKKGGDADEPSKKKQKKESSRVLADEDDVADDADVTKKTAGESDEEEDDFFL